MDERKLENRLSEMVGTPEFLQLCTDQAKEQMAAGRLAIAAALERYVDVARLVKRTADKLARAIKAESVEPRQHPVAVGESVRRTTEGSIAPFGTLGRVLVVWSDAYQVELRKGFSTMWAFDDCTPCDPPTASHDTPAGKETAQAAAEPKPGDVVRLV